MGVFRIRKFTASFSGWIEGRRGRAFIVAFAKNPRRKSRLEIDVRPSKRRLYLVYGEDIRNCSLLQEGGPFGWFAVAGPQTLFVPVLMPYRSGPPGIWPSLPPNHPSLPPSHPCEITIAEV